MVDQQAIYNEVRAIMDKHGLKDGAFCAMTDDGFFGSLMHKEDTALSVFNSIISVGRLWQHARNSCRAMLSEFEKAWD